MRFKLSCIIISLLLAGKVAAQTHASEFGFQTDDDSYLLQGSDRYYTDGTFLFFRHALKIRNADSAKLRNKVLGFEFGQKLYTPQSASIFLAGKDQPTLVDRPFAAYLYVGSTLNLLYANESNLKLGAQIGVVGPAALGKQTQTVFHKTFGFYPPSGWEYQVDNNAELNLSAEYNKLIYRSSSIDISFAGYANLGNGFTGAGVGPLFRIGDFNQLFNSVSTQSTAIQKSPVSPLHQREFFFYYKPQFNVIAYDATVEGSLFGGRNANSMEITLDPERFVFSNQLGLAYTTNRFVFDISATIHTKDVVQMTMAHQWGSISVMYRFN